MGKLCWSRGVAVALAGLVLWGVSGCKVEAGEGDGDSDFSLEEIDTGDLQDTAQQVADEVADIEICPGYTVEELFEADSLSEECREALLSFLPEDQNDFESRIVAPGGLRVVDGEVRALLQAADAEGNALHADAFAGLQVEVTVEGTARVLAEGEFSLAVSADLPEALLAVSVVNDYSSSMFDRDIRDVAEVEGEIFECLPPVYEAEVVRFSELVETHQEFTAELAALLDAVAYDEGFDRGTTALLDGIGVATASLGAHPAPVKVLVLSTDGGENASTMFSEPEVFGALDEAGVFVVVMGALLADVDFMRDLARDRGVYFYTREFSALQDAASPYLDSLKSLVELRIPDLDPPPASVRLELEGGLVVELGE